MTTDKKQNKTFFPIWEEAAISKRKKNTKAPTAIYSELNGNEIYSK
jgi:hypothetical protein